MPVLPSVCMYIGFAESTDPVETNRFIRVLVFESFASLSLFWKSNIDVIMSPIVSRMSQDRPNMSH